MSVCTKTTAMERNISRRRWEDLIFLEELFGQLRHWADSISVPQDMNDNCPMTEWSEWSPCTASCGRGSKIRTRLRVSSEEAVMSGSQDYINSEGEDPCLHVKTSQEVACDGDYPNCEMLLQQAKGKSFAINLGLISCGILKCFFIAEICQMPQDPGPCRGYVERWFFDVKSETCRPFVFNGCRGNQNNFFSKEDCERTCSVLKGKQMKWKKKDVLMLHDIQ